ncbi:MAG: transcriptional repressor, partial [Phascolarctobacterium sp.]|nr:transcriptional repressor [Phascolarctobacterium sp.]
KYEKMIFDIIYKEPRHLTAEDIYRELKELEPKVVLASVYNNLKVLHEKRLIHKVTVEGMPDRYDSIERHDHVVCTKCGDLYDFKFKDITHELEEKLGISISGYELNVNYICPSCKKSLSTN